MDEQTVMEDTQQWNEVMPYEETKALCIRACERLLPQFRAFQDVSLEDLVQDSILIINRFYGDYDPKKARYSTWVFSVLRNHLLNRYNSLLARAKRDNSAVAFEENVNGQGLALAAGLFYQAMINASHPPKRARDYTIAQLAHLCQWSSRHGAWVMNQPDMMEAVGLSTPISYRYILRAIKRCDGFVTPIKFSRHIQRLGVMRRLNNPGRKV